MILSWDDLQTLRKEVLRLKGKGEILDPRNAFERRELQCVIKELKEIANIGNNTKKPRILRIVK